LVASLGNEDHECRLAASRSLLRLGPPALPALRKAARHSDLETRTRAKQIIARIESRLRVPPGWRALSLPCLSREIKSHANPPKPVERVPGNKIEPDEDGF
jgi:hypothetical protein